MGKPFTAFILSTCLLASSVSAQDTPAPAPSPTPTPTPGAVDEEARAKKLANDKLEFDLKKDKAATIAGALPTTDTTGAVSAAPETGQAEVNALAIRVIGALADRMVAKINLSAKDFEPNPPPAAGKNGAACDELNAIGTSADQPRVNGDDRAGRTFIKVPILITSDFDGLALNQWSMFKIRACRTSGALTTAIANANKALLDFKKIPMPKAAPKKGPPPGGSVLVAAQVATAALKLLQSDWSLIPIKSNLTARPLIIEIMRAYHDSTTSNSAGIYWVEANSRLNTAPELFGALNTLETSNRVAARISLNLAPDIKAGKTALDNPKVDKRMAAAVAALEAAQADLTDAIGGYAQLTKDVFGGEATSPMPLTSVIAGAASARVVGNSGLILSVNVESIDGTGMSRKSFLNTFSPGPSFYVSGTVAVGYTLYRVGSGATVGEGEYVCSTGAIRLSNVKTALDAGKFCKPA